MYSEISISEAATLLVASNEQGVFAKDLMDEMNEGGWTDNEVRECLRALVKNGTLERRIEVRPRIITRYTLGENAKAILKDVRRPSGESPHKPLPNPLRRIDSRTRHPTPLRRNPRKSSTHSRGRTLLGNRPARF